MGVAWRLFQLARRVHRGDPSLPGHGPDAGGVGYRKTAKCSRSSGGRSRRPSRKRSAVSSPTARPSSEFCEPRHDEKLRETLHRPRFEVAGMVAMSNNENRHVSHTCAVSENNSNSKPPQAANRRRASQIVHDDRGNARVEWIDAGYAGVPLERAPLSIESTPPRGDNAKLSVERNALERFRSVRARRRSAHSRAQEAASQARPAQARRVDQAQARAGRTQVAGRPRRRVGLLRRAIATSQFVTACSASSGVALDVAHLAHVPPAIEPA